MLHFSYRNLLLKWLASVWKATLSWNELNSVSLSTYFFYNISDNNQRIFRKSHFCQTSKIWHKTLKTKSIRVEKFFFENAVFGILKFPNRLLRRNLQLYDTLLVIKLKIIFSICNKKKISLFMWPITNFWKFTKSLSPALNKVRGFHLCVKKIALFFAFATVRDRRQISLLILSKFKWIN